MIAYIKGILTDIADETIVVETAGIGYNIKVSANLIQMLPQTGNEVKIYTYTCVREDAFLLYGFLTRDDLEIFRKCITVNGIGPKGALAILSVMDADSLRFAIIAGDARAIAKAPGIGAKTAERLILDLRDKVKLEDTSIDGTAMVQAGLTETAGTQKKEAVEALVALGYSASEALNAVNRVDNLENLDAESILKAALKQMF